MPRHRLYGTILLLAGLAACRAESQDPPPPAQVLFIGNSLTAFNELPDLMVRVARSAGDSEIAAVMVARPNYAILDHWEDGTALDELRTKRWTHVVLQQGPSSQEEGAVWLRDGMRRFDPVVRAAGAEPVLYMVWPQRSRAADFPGVLRNYRDAAALVNGIFAPAGDAWVAAFEADPAAPLYGPDDFHPSLEGSYLAAVVLLARVRGIDPLSLPSTIPGSSLPEPRVRALQRAAVVALERNPARP
ncbi:MAG TPA: hypothetical protein VFY20_06895 [Gemmatimonadales bacterium]|nr:hypothetical protein [Gemmatimonadales bacterium]